MSVSTGQAMRFRLRSAVPPGSYRTPFVELRTEHSPTRKSTLKSRLLRSSTKKSGHFRGSTGALCLVAQVQSPPCSQRTSCEGRETVHRAIRLSRIFQTAWPNYLRATSAILADVKQPHPRRHQPICQPSVPRCDSKNEPLVAEECRSAGAQLPLVKNPFPQLIVAGRMHS